MPTYKILTLLTIGLIAIKSSLAHAIEPLQTNAAMEIATVTKMYEQDISTEGMDNPVVLQQYANQDLQSAMQLEQDYFDENQLSCNIDYDVLWDSQDPDYTQDKKFSMTNQGLVQVSLAQGSNIYYDLSCDGDGCQVADVILDENGKSLRQHFLESCR
jgi:hypothetical protein